MPDEPQLNPIGKFAEYYTSKPSLQALAQFLPGGGRMSALLKLRAEEIAKGRAVVFFEELENGSLELTPELIQSEDFVHRYVITAKAAANTRRREKIRLFARLLNSSFTPESQVTTDEYEEYLGILDDLSFREFSILTILEELEATHPIKEGEGELKRVRRYWEQFLSQINLKFALSEGEINAILARLNRTGCYITFTGAFFDYDGNQGQLTELYFKIKKLLQ